VGFFAGTLEGLFCRDPLGPKRRRGVRGLCNAYTALYWHLYCYFERIQPIKWINGIQMHCANTVTIASDIENGSYEIQ
jgi:hypothetical protein